MAPTSDKSRHIPPTSSASIAPTTRSSQPHAPLAPYSPLPPSPGTPPKVPARNQTSHAGDRCRLLRTKCSGGVILVTSAVRIKRSAFLAIGKGKDIRSLIAPLLWIINVSEEAVGDGRKPEELWHARLGHLKSGRLARRPPSIRHSVPTVDEPGAAGNAALPGLHGG
jgi:hypothetical protein